MKNRGSRKLVHRCKLIEGELVQVEQHLQQIVEAAGPEIVEVGSYVFNGSGKRMRPTLFLLAAYQPQGQLYPFINAATAMELMHTASLLHDDVIDQAKTRRGKATVPVRWNNKISVLTGDYLLSQSFKLLVGYHHWPLMDIMAEVIQNMAEGEIEQAFANNDSTALEERYFQWIGKKSASFFAGCCRSGSMMKGSDPAEQATWSEFGYNLGMAFQLIDDLLDYTGKGELTGKPVYGDLNNRVLTLPLIRTIRHTRQNGTINSLFKDGSSDSQFSEVVQAVFDSDGPDYTYRKAQEYIALANSSITMLQEVDEIIKDELRSLTKSLLKQTF